MLTRADLRPPVVADPYFDSIVDDDLEGTADAESVELLEADPRRWRACLKARLAYLDKALLTLRRGGTSIVEVVDGSGTIRSFETRVSQLPRARLEAIFAAAKARKERAGILYHEQIEREREEQAAEKRRMQMERNAARTAVPPAETNFRRKELYKHRIATLEGLLEQAIAGDESWRAGVVAYCVEFRRGLPLGMHDDVPRE